MPGLLDILGRGLLAELRTAYRDLLHDDGRYATHELASAADREPSMTDDQPKSSGFGAGIFED